MELLASLWRALVRLLWPTTLGLAGLLGALLGDVLAAIRRYA